MKLVLALLLAPAIASADPLTMKVASHAGQLDVTWTNTTAAPVKMMTHVRAGDLHYDYLTVKLTAGKTTRTMHFIESRTKAIPIEETIAPGKSLTRSVDLVWWSIHGENTGGPLDGSYDVEATWDTGAAAPKVKLTASTKLVIPAAKETSCKDSGSTGIELLGHQGAGSKVEVGLHNTDTATHCVYGYIKTHEIQSDWLVLVVGDKAQRRIGLSDDRDKSAPVAIELPPGATAWSTWDLADWSKRHGAKPLAGSFWLTATYDAGRERDVWHGKVTTGFSVKLP